MGSRLTYWLFMFYLTSASGTMRSDDESDPRPDLTKVKWDHAVNSKAKLNASLSGTADMIEADVVLGRVIGDPTGMVIPIMAHPPNNESDLSLLEFIETFMAAPTEKGLKLDFKSTKAYTASFDVFSKSLLAEDIFVDFPLWLNADIHKGPGGESTTVDADEFLSTAASKVPFAVLSVGWTTGVDSSDDKYTGDMITAMSESLNKNCIMQPVTFAVRASLVPKSEEALSYLMATSTDESTLTIWCSSESDVVDTAALKRFIDKVGKDKVYLDLPHSMHEAVMSPSSSPELSPVVALVAAALAVAFVR